MTYLALHVISAKGLLSRSEDGHEPAAARHSTRHSTRHPTRHSPPCSSRYRRSEDGHDANPFVTATWDQVSQQTRVVRRSTAPQFGETIYFPLRLLTLHGEEGKKALEKKGGAAATPPTHPSHASNAAHLPRPASPPPTSTAHRRAHAVRARLLPFRLRHARLPPHWSRSGDGPGHSHTLPHPATPTSHPISSASVSIRSPTRRRASSATSRPECSNPRRCRSPSRARARRSARSTCRRVVPPPPPQHQHLLLLHHLHHLHHLPPRDRRTSRPISRRRSSSRRASATPHSSTASSPSEKRCGGRRCRGGSRRAAATCSPLRTRPTRSDSCPRTCASATRRATLRTR